MRVIRTSLDFTSRIFWFLMALHLFNFSMDSPDRWAQSLSEDLSINDIESITELVVEEILNIEGAFREHEESDTEHTGSFDVKLLFGNNSGGFCINALSPASRKSFTPYLSSFFDLAIDVTVPPPEV